MIYDVALRHAFRLATSFGLIAVLDEYVCRPHSSDATVRWFFLHAATNVAIAASALSGAAAFCNDPMQAFEDVDVGAAEYVFSATSKWPLTLCVAIHVYHVARFRLTTDDVFHHGLFLPTVCIPGMVYDWGCLCNWLVSFVCGVPGAVDYFVLAMQKEGRLGGWNQKRLSANLNVWVRLPGTLTGTVIAAVLYRQGVAKGVPTWALITQVVFLSFNVLYYTKQSVLNYALHSVREYIPSADWTQVKKLR